MNLAFEVPAGFKALVLAALRRYWASLQDGTAGYLFPNPGYRWRHYTEEKRTLDYARAVLKDLDAYWEVEGNLGWAKMNYGTPRGEVFQAGPGLSRLSDAAVMALWQELDGLYADEVEMGQKR